MPDTLATYWVAEIPLGVRFLAWDRWFASSNRRNCFFVSLKALPRFHPVPNRSRKRHNWKMFCAIESRRGNCFLKRIDRIELLRNREFGWLFGAASRRLYFGNSKTHSCDFFVSLCWFDWKGRKKVRSTSLRVYLSIFFSAFSCEAVDAVMI